MTLRATGRCLAPLLLASLIAACHATTGYPLPTREPSITACGGVGMTSLVLHGSLVNGAPRLWTNADETTILWPPGYVARFEPALVVVDGGGTVRAREGDDLLTTGAVDGLFACPSGFHGVMRIWDNQPTTQPSAT
jgi:hypothetical protein